MSKLQKTTNLLYINWHKIGNGYFVQNSIHERQLFLFSGNNDEKFLYKYEWINEWSILIVIILWKIVDIKKCAFSTFSSRLVPFRVQFRFPLNAKNSDFIGVFYWSWRTESLGSAALMTSPTARFAPVPGSYTRLKMCI